jgi:ATP-binding cassette subfamily B protein
LGLKCPAKPGKDLPREPSAHARHQGLPRSHLRNENSLAQPDPLLSKYAAPALVRRLLFEQGLTYWRRYLVAFTLMGISAGATALIAYLMGNVINQVYLSRSFEGVLTLGLITMGLFTVKGFATYGQAVIMQQIGNRIVAANQRRLFHKLLHQGIDFFADRHSSEFIMRLNTGASSATQVLNLLISAFGRDLLTLIGLVVVMVVQDPMLSFIALVVAPPAMIFLRRLIKRVRGIALNQFTGSTRITETLQEMLQGLRIVKAYTLENFLQSRFDADVAAFESESNKLARVSNRSSPMMEMLGGIAISLALIYSGHQVIVLGSPPGAFVSFMTAFLLAYEPAKRLVRVNVDINSALTGVRILFDIIDSPAAEQPDVNMPPLKLSAGRVELRDVRFAYRPDELVLRGMSFVAEPGKVTALVGPSGGGKSTVLNLLLRFHDIREGAITIDGQNIGAVSRHSLRSQLAYVGQDVFLFRGTIRDNIAIGRPEASEADIVAAAKAACAHEFILGFPRGYDTPVGEHGLQLSGGQRQRVSVARALIKDAPIILLDEATASLDAESERQVQIAIEELCRGRTTIAIAHRLHTVVHANRIHVIEDGRVAESGRHDELLHKGGRYASFYRLQLADQESTLPLAAVASSA